jgi:hypothetical protein
LKAAQFNLSQKNQPRLVLTSHYQKDIDTDNQTMVKWIEKKAKPDLTVLQLKIYFN